MRYLLVSLLVLVFTAGETLAKPSLKPNVVVDGPVITLSDVFEDAEEFADIIVAAAPSPGKRISIKTDYIAALAYAKGLKWPGAGGLARIIVTRASHIVPRGQIAAALSESIRDAGFIGEFDIEMRNRNFELHVPAGASTRPAVRDLDVDLDTGYFSAHLVAPADDPLATPVRVSGRAHAIIELPVLLNYVGAGDLIGEEDIGWKRVRARKVRRNLVVDIDQIVGKSPRRPIQPGRLIRASDVEPPVTITKGAVVTMVVSARGMTLTATGRAAESGGNGDVIRVVNLKSMRTVHGVVTGPNQVNVDLTPKIATAVN